ncbi:MAG: hypothetical protein Unbinned6316contig1000_25 [Prokaryotic dsDNA virus sp.]|nr:MAG: hypothetical protein Unbinned6316contig1000_25 [Prokaryotic dsDNA virus sp.]|tara:strand:- start:1233 stop:1751 length:519 start_codon:yes stop_codon:yes gene_type:complete
MRDIEYIEKFKSICKLATKTMNLPEDIISSKSRKRELQVVRQVAAYIGRYEEGIHQNYIAEVLNRDRTLIYYYESTHKSHYKTCPIYRETFNKIYKAYLDIEGSKEVFINGEIMKEHLLKNGVKENPIAEVKIKVTSGQCRCVIKTTYFDFADQLKFIKFALANYHFNVKLI